MEILRNVGLDDFTLKPKWVGESEEISETNSIENKRNIESKSSKSHQHQQSSKPPISKIYLRNVTLIKGDMAILRCHQSNENKQNGNRDKNKKIRADYSYFNNNNNNNNQNKKNNYSNMKTTNLDESLSIKTIIWSYEPTDSFPRLLTNNDDNFQKQENKSIKEIKDF